MLFGNAVKQLFQKLNVNLGHKIKLCDKFQVDMLSIARNSCQTAVQKCKTLESLNLNKCQ